MDYINYNLIKWISHVHLLTFEIVLLPNNFVHTPYVIFQICIKEIIHNKFQINI